MARIGCRANLHYLFHKFNRENPLALISSNFLVQGVSLGTCWSYYTQGRIKHLTILFYLRNYKVRIGMKYCNSQYIHISIGCLKIIVSAVTDIITVSFKMMYGSAEAHIHFVQNKVYCNKVMMDIKGRDGHMRQVHRSYQYDNPPYWDFRFMVVNDTTDIITLLVSRLEVISSAMMYMYHKHIDKYGRVCINNYVYDDRDYHDVAYVEYDLGVYYVVDEI